jgi:PhzF family phenazine biosynthesis protein
LNNESLYRISAFANGPNGGNPAGVWIGDELPESAAMQAIAADVGYSETAFVAPATGAARTIRYYSPEAEVSFCGHATIAAGAVVGRLSGDGQYDLESSVGVIPIVVANRDGDITVSLESVEPENRIPGDHLIDQSLHALRWSRTELEFSIPPACAYAGAWHLVLAVSDRATLARLDYDFDALKKIMLAENLTTLQLIWRENDSVFHARDPFPVGGVVEDPATGAAAAALGGYLRSAGLVAAPTTISIHQGHDMGRPSLLSVQIPETGGIIVSGTASKL